MNNYVFYKADRISETVEKQEFATNNTGEGLFRWCGNGELKQELGNCQFYSNGTDMVRKINRIFANGVYGRKYVRFYKTEKGAEKFAKS